MAFFKGDQALEQIEARKRAEIEIQRSQLEEQAKQQNIQEVFKQKELFNALRDAAIASGTPVEQADTVARQQYAQYLASGPTAETGRNNLSTALSSYGKAKIGGATPYAATTGQTEELGNISDAIAKITGNTNAVNRNLGSAPLQSTAGKANIQNEISGNTANQAENLNRYNIARERSVTAPMLSTAQDWEGIERSKLGGMLAQSSQGLAPALAEAQAKSGISKANEDTAASNYKSTVFSKIDPGLAAQAENAGYGSAATEANLITSTKGLIGGKVPYSGEMGGGIGAIPGVNEMVSTALWKAMQNGPTGTPGTNALPARPGVLFKLPVIQNH